MMNSSADLLATHPEPQRTTEISKPRASTLISKQTSEASGTSAGLATGPHLWTSEPPEKGLQGL